MWISKKEYDELLNSKFFWEKECDIHKERAQDLFVEMNFKRQDTNLLRDENSKLKAQVEEYKQKYADEINKRLELIKFYEERYN